MCPNCGKQMRLIAFVTEGPRIRKTLDHVGGDTAPSPLYAGHPCGTTMVMRRSPEGVKGEPDLDLAAQPASDCEVDQRQWVTG